MPGQRSKGTHQQPPQQEWKETNRKDQGAGSTFQAGLCAKTSGLGAIVAVATVRPGTNVTTFPIVDRESELGSEVKETQETWQ